jgi:ribosome biogenesis SPOUT family RNA methylase Rps3
MTTDTAVRVTRLVASGQKLSEIAYVDRPDIVIPPKKNQKGPAESVSMPFKYVQDTKTGQPIMPKGMFELLCSDADKGIMDLL